MRWYIAGPVTNMPHYNEPAFRRAAASIRARDGEQAHSPLEQDRLEGVPLGTHTWAEYMRRDIPEMLGCDGVAVLDGWERSRGASLEVKVARACGMPVVDAMSLRDLGDSSSDWHEQADGAAPSTNLGPISSKLVDGAERLVDGPRQDDYGDPLENCTRAAALWEPILACEVTPEQVAMCMIQIKVARLIHRYKADTTLDIRGYSLVLDRIVEGQGG